ncbi:MAG: divalent metal cation transporter [Candidatus Nitrosopolaris sp.]
MKLMRSDVTIGMALSQLVMWAIVTTAGSLHSDSITNIQTADQAAKSLEPVVKSCGISKTIFALGIVDTGLLAGNGRAGKGTIRTDWTWVVKGNNFGKKIIKVSGEND